MGLVQCGREHEVVERVTDLSDPLAAFIDAARVPLHAQPAPAAQPGGNRWQFNDEDEKTPTLVDSVRSQAVVPGISC